MTGTPRTPDATRAAAVFGFGLGGLADGIVLHQILQWHHLVSSNVPDDSLEGLQHNTLADGIFHAVTLVVVVVGTVLLARSRPDGGRGRIVVGGGLIGFGAFHVVDAVVFHALLGVHHIRMVDDPLPYDLAFVALGVAAVLAGAVLLRRDGHPVTAP